MDTGIEKLMNSDEMKVLGVDSMTTEQREKLKAWGMRMYSLGQYVFSEISVVKYDGRLVILDDGTRWEVDEVDSVTASLWDPMDKVVVIDGEMYKVDETDKVAVQEDYD